MYPEDFFALEISDEIKNRIIGKSFPLESENIAITFDDLRYLQVLYVDFDGETQIGELICNKSIAEDLLEIFYRLYINDYKIEKIRLIDEYDADDEKSMSDNNSSSFNYRVIANTNKLSNHALGKAVDINPKYNPYITHINGETIIAPNNSAEYVDRTKDFDHKITHDDLCYKLFHSHGFDWGGDWDDSKDYQHFDKK